jgi:hypothetical protein
MKWMRNKELQIKVVFKKNILNSWGYKAAAHEEMYRVLRSLTKVLGMSYHLLVH